jgi:hypothetical protein
MSCGYRKRIIRRKSKEPPCESSSRSNCINNDCEAPGQGPQPRYPRKLLKRQQPPLNTSYHRLEPGPLPLISRRIPTGRCHHQSHPTSPCLTERDLPTSPESRLNQQRPIHSCDSSPYSTNQWKIQGSTREPCPGKISERQNRNLHRNQTRQNQMTILSVQEVLLPDHPDHPDRQTHRDHQEEEDPRVNHRQVDPLEDHHQLRRHLHHQTLHRVPLQESLRFLSHRHPRIKRSPMLKHQRTSLRQRSGIVSDDKPSSTSRRIDETSTMIRRSFDSC